MRRLRAPGVRPWPAAALFLLVSWSGVAFAVECRLAPDGSITTWLVAPAYQLDTDAGFDKDVLPEGMGEASGFRRVEGAGPVGWRGLAFNSPVMWFEPWCLKRGSSVVYAACELRARKAGDYTLTAQYWAKLAVWLDGKRVLEDAEDDTGALPARSGTITLEAGRTHHLLVKIGSKERNAVCRITLTASGAEPGPAPIDVVLRVPEEREAELFAQSLALSTPKNSVLVRTGGLVPTRLGVSAGGPVLDETEFIINADLLDDKGNFVQPLGSAVLKADDLAGAVLALPWQVPRDSVVPAYTVRVRVQSGGRVVGGPSEVFYHLEGIVAWNKALRGRLENAELQLGEDRRYTEPDVAFARLKLDKSQLLAQVEKPDIRAVFSELQACEGAVARLEKHERPPDEKGLNECAYLSTVDDSPQPYYVYVPERHDGRTCLPVIVYLHGYSPELDEPDGEMVPHRLLDYCDQYGYYLVAPFGRGNPEFRGIGERDVIWVFEQFARRYPVDPDRVFLFGYSMGGTGAFTVGAHYPDVWAGIISVSGRSDYYLWKGLDREKVEAYKCPLIDADSGAGMAGNLRNVPVLMCHGVADALVKIEQPRAMLEKLKKLGADATLNELPDRDHWILDDVLADDAVFKWMADRRRNAWPDEVDFTTQTIKYRQAHWVTVLDLVRWGEPVTVHAKFSADKSVLDVQTQNVASLRLDLSEELVGAEPKLIVRVNGAEHQVDRPGPATFSIEEARRTGKLRKTPRLCGPVREATSRRFLIVAGTGPVGPGGLDQGQVDRFQREAGGAMLEWMVFAKSAPLMKRDIDVTPVDVQRSNLILYGAPSTNERLREIADQLPIRVTDDGFEFQGKTYGNKDHGLVMVYPNPLSPARLVVVRSGLPYGAGLSAADKFDLLPDFIIFTDEKDPDGSNKAVVAGFFDRDWQVDERLIWRADGGGEEQPVPLDKTQGPE